MGRQDWRTPPSVFSLLDRKFGPFDCDLAADEHNHLCKNWVGEDGLHGERGEVNWCNPPFGNIMPFVNDAILCGFCDGSMTVMLTHNNCCSPWFRKASQHAALYLPDRRIAFWHPNEEPGSPDRDTVIWYFGGKPKTVHLINLPGHSSEIRSLWAQANGQRVMF